MTYDLDHGDREERTGLYADPRAPEEAPHSGRLLRVIGALLVMAVFAGGLWFAYTQGLHRAGGSADRGEVPLVRADSTPFKVKPENPGGMQIPDRDMLIYGQQRPQVEHLLPPPEQPMARPTPPPAPPPAKEAANSTPPPTALPPKQASLQPAPQTPSLPPLQALPGAAPKAPVQAAGNSNPAPTLSPSGLQEPPPQVPSAAAAQPSPPPPANSEIGSTAPNGQSPPTTDLIGQKIEQLEAAATGSRAKRTETGRSGGLRLQLGASRSESEARGAWERLKRSNADLLGNLTGAAVRADLGEKGIYYRIETGPIGDPATAARVCGELRQRHLACMLVR
jgi:SPOR domain